MLPRMIDIARAMLTGGRAGDYQIGRHKSLSAAVLGAFRLSTPEFVDVVRDAKTEEEVAEHLWRAASVSPDALSRRLRRITVANVPPEMSPDFQRLYGEQAADRLVFDVLDADDARAFAQKA